MEIKQVNIKDLNPYPNNPRANDQAVDAVAESIKQFGFKVPIVIDKDNVIITGHTRLKAATKLGLKTVPVILADDLTPDQVKAFRLADNKTGEIAVWDFDKLEAELNDIDMDMEDFGFDEVETETEGLTDEDEVPKDVEPVCQLGQLWALGRHRVLCGDATSKDDVERLMDGEKAELLFTSPPYSDMREYNGGKDLSITNLIEFIPAFFNYAEYQVINLGIQRKDNEIVQYWDDYIRKAKDSGYKFLSWNVWSREGMGGSIANMSAMFRMEHEWIFVFGKERKPLNNTKKNKSAGLRKGISNRQRDGSTKKVNPKIVKDLGRISSVSTMCYGNSKEHPAVFPVNFPIEYIKAMTNNIDSIIDPFLGSGSTLIAAEKTNRKCYGMEIDPHYCDVIIKRWEDFTGLKAELIK